MSNADSYAPSNILVFVCYVNFMKMEIENQLPKMMLIAKKVREKTNSPPHIEDLMLNSQYS